MARPTTIPRYTVIKGQYSIHNAADPRHGPEPDGDTVTFFPDSLDLVRTLKRFSGRPPDIRNGHINIRYEGIDALETHFQGTHQDLTFANAARERNLAALGFTNVRFFPDLPNVVQSVDRNPLQGYVIANGIESNGRLLGLVYAGATHRQDGSKVFVNNAILDPSVNATLVDDGLAFVEPYDTMPISLVQHLRAKIAAARASGKGLWPSESPTTGQAARIPNLDDLQALVMWPKLFRRLADYFREGHIGLGQFESWIRDDVVRRDDALRLPNGEAGNMHDTFLVEGDTLRLQFRPEELLIAPDPSPVTP
jgi:endonuclease YncB( thermonuclease family)